MYRIGLRHSAYKSVTKALTAIADRKSLPPDFSDMKTIKKLRTISFECSIFAEVECTEYRYDPNELSVVMTSLINYEPNIRQVLEVLKAGKVEVEIPEVFDGKPVIVLKQK